MPANDGVREYIELMLELLDISRDQLEEADDKLKQVSNHVRILFGTSDDTAMFLHASIQTNHDDIHRVRQRNKAIRDKLEAAWRSA